MPALLQFRGLSHDLRAVASVYFSFGAYVQNKAGVELLPSTVVVRRFSPPTGLPHMDNPTMHEQPNLKSEILRQRAKNVRGNSQTKLPLP